MNPLDVHLRIWLSQSLGFPNHNQAFIGLERAVAMTLTCKAGLRHTALKVLKP